MILYQCDGCGTQSKTPWQHKAEVELDDDGDETSHRFDFCAGCFNTFRKKALPYNWPGAEE